MRRGPRRLLALLAAVTVGLLPTAATASPASVQAQEWWIGRLDLQHAWQLSTGRGVTVAVLDTGVDPTRGDLHGALLPGIGPDHGQHDFDTQHEHGTNMATLIAGRGTGPGMKGVAPAATILPVTTVDSSQALGVREALDALLVLPHRPRVVNMSMGSPGPCPPDLQAAVKQAVAAGMILVAGSGDDGNITNFAGYPADCAGVVAVGAVDTDGRPWPNSTHHSYVAIAGPGVDIVSFPGTGRAGENSSGTSAATAMVSGVFALLVQHFPQLSSRQIVARVLATARQFQGAQGSRNDWSGFGVVRAYHALTDDVPADAPNPVYDALDRLAPTGGPNAATSTPPARSPSPAAASGTSGGGGIGLPVIVGIAGAVVVLAGLLFLLLRGRRRTT